MYGYQHWMASANNRIKKLSISFAMPLANETALRRSFELIEMGVYVPRRLIMTEL